MLNDFSDQELQDIGIARGEIDYVAMNRFSIREVSDPPVRWMSDCFEAGRAGCPNIARWRPLPARTGRGRDANAIRLSSSA